MLRVSLLSIEEGYKYADWGAFAVNLVASTPI